MRNSMEVDQPPETSFTVQNWHAQGIANTLHVWHLLQLGAPNPGSHSVGQARMQKSGSRQAPRKVANALPLMRSGNITVFGASSPDGSLQHQLRTGMKRGPVFDLTNDDEEQRPTKRRMTVGASSGSTLSQVPNRIDLQPVHDKATANTAEETIPPPSALRPNTKYWAPDKWPYLSVKDWRDINFFWKHANKDILDVERDKRDMQAKIVWEADIRAQQGKDSAISKAEVCTLRALTLIHPNNTDVDRSIQTAMAAAKPHMDTDWVVQHHYPTNRQTVEEHHAGDVCCGD